MTLPEGWLGAEENLLGGMGVSEIAPSEALVVRQFAIARLIYRILGRVRASRRVH